MSSKHVTEVTDKDFEQVVLQSEIPVVVDFWAPWCGPCMAFASVFENVSKTATGRALFVKINVDDSPVVADQFEVTAIPTIAIFKNGELVDRALGAQEGLDAINKLLDI